MKKRLTKDKFNNTGFTMIELLIVVMIISILSGLILSVVNVSGLRSKSRDSQRVAELKKIQAALELYYTDNRAYPSTAWLRVTGSDSMSNALESGGYLNSVPADPVNNSTNPGPCNNITGYRYNYISDAQRYILTAIMEIATSNDDSTCHSLVSWSTLNSSCGNLTYATNDYCYGVENP